MAGEEIPTGVDPPGIILMGGTTGDPRGCCVGIISCHGYGFSYLIVIYAVDAGEATSTRRKTEHIFPLAKHERVQHCNWNVSLEKLGT